jgi:hypothetical protein
LAFPQRSEFFDAVAAMLSDLRPMLCRGVLLALLFGSAFTLAWFTLADGSGLWLVAVAGGLILSLVGALVRDWSLFVLAWRTRRFHTLADDRIVLRYDPAVRSVVDPTELLAQAGRILGELEAKFGRLTLFWHGRTLGPLLFRRRIHLYVFLRAEELREIFGDRYLGGIALMTHHAIVFPLDGLPLDEVLRHELTHLFTDRWNPMAPLLVREGMPTWLQETFSGVPIDALAACLLIHERLRLRTLLNAHCFHDERTRGASYIVAGSLTGYLLNRFGWSAYRRFYQRQGFLRRFDVHFRRAFGVTLDEAEREWTDGLRKRYEQPIADLLENERREAKS